MSRAFTFAIVLSFVLAAAAAMSVLEDGQVDCSKKEHMASCSYWKSKGYCQKGGNAMYYQYVSKKCPVTCGRCPGITQPKPPKYGPVKVNTNECLKAHNDYRADHHAPLLRWDYNMARQAQAYANQLARERKMQHDNTTRGKQGENLAMMSSSSSYFTYTCKQATKSWYDEVQDYSYWNPGFSPKTGHFTQVVWKNTRRLGVGIAKNGGFIIVVARYYPPGNVNNRGQFRANVLRL